MKESSVREALEGLIAAMTTSRGRAHRTRTAGMPRSLRPHRTRSTFVPSRAGTRTSHVVI